MRGRKTCFQMLFKCGRPDAGIRVGAGAGIGVGSRRRASIIVFVVTQISKKYGPLVREICSGLSRRASAARRHVSSPARW